MSPITEDANNAPINWPTLVSGGDGSVATVTATATATVKCPRCNSPNTKFCYYNNYSLSQPRHFCKTCRRYWTKGGALRNIPVGGGCRKNKKSRSSFSTLSSAAKLFSSSSSSSSSSHHHQHQLLLPPPDRNNFFKSQVLGFGTFASPSQGFATPFLSFGDLSSTTETEAQQPVVESGKNHNLLLTSSIESLFSTNQLLHWKLLQQQQHQKQMIASPFELLLQNNNSTSASPSEAQLPVLPSSFHLLQQPSFPFHVAPTESSSVEQVGGSRINGDSTSDWFLGSSYAVEGFNPNANSTSRADWTAVIPTWNLDMDRFTAL